MAASKKTGFAIVGIVVLGALVAFWVARKRAPSAQAPDNAKSELTSGSIDAPAGQNGITPTGMFERIRSSSQGPTTEVRGRVLNASSKEPVASADVVFIARAGEFVTQSGSDGRFSIEIPANTYSVRAIGDRIAGALPISVRVEPSPRPLEIELLVEELAMVSGKVVSGNRSAAGATVSQLLANAGNRTMIEQGYVVGNVAADDVGHFEIGVLGTEATLEARVGYLRGQAKVSGLRAGKTLSGVVINIPPGATVRGIVVDPNGRAVSDAKVHATSTASGSGISQDAVTGSDGRFSLEAMPPGELSIEAWAQGFSDAVPVERTAAAGATVELKIALQASLSISGTVTNEDDAPLSGARVRTGRDWRIQETRTDEKGRFIIAGMTSTPMWVGASHPGYSNGVLQDVVPPATDLKLKVWRKASLKGKVTSSAGKPVPDFQIKVERYTARGDTTKEGGDPTRFANPGGYFELGDRPPGAYDLLVSAAGFADKRMSNVDVPPGSSTDVAVVLEPSGK